MTKEKLMERFKGKRLIRRIVIMLISVTVMGMGISFYRLAAMGADPCSTMNLGISARIGLPFGVWQAILNTILLIIIFFVDRSMLGIGTIGNMFICGFAADLFSPVLESMFAATDELGIPLRVVLTIIGVALQLVGVSFYVTADLGMAPYDCISYIIPDKTGIPFRWWRIIEDVSAVAIGLLISIGIESSASFGLGTILMAFCTGPIIPVLNRHLAAPILKTDKVR